MKLLYVAIGGAVGALVRYLVSDFCLYFLPIRWRFPTLAVNILGCFIAGILVGYFARSGRGDDTLRPLLLIGFCGGLTTFSTFSLENYELILQGRPSAALFYTFCSVAGGLFGIWTGRLLLR